MRQQRLSAVLVAVFLLAARLAFADAWDAPASYYNGATGSGATLKNQLRTIMSTGHIQRTYGDFRFSAAIHDADPNNPNNILLVYNRESVAAMWDSGGTWDREHIWPQSLQGGGSNVGNNDIGPRADPHTLRPCNPMINGSRGNKPFGFESNTGNHGATTGGYYFPGDADKGDVARQLFYMDTRWTNTGTGLSLTDSFPVSYQMGDLSSLIAWHYLDVPDEFERRRNHTIYSQAYNPLYYTNNRNAFVDRPEYVWSIYMDQMNDSQISIDGTTVGADGSSTRNVDLGRVFVGGAVPSAQNFTLNKGGSAGTYYSVTTAGPATSSITGRYNAFSMGGADSESIAIGLDTDTLTSGLRSGTVTIDNLDITSGGCSGAGCGANDANDTFHVSLAVLDHPVASFSSDDEQRERVIDFGVVTLGSGTQSWESSLANLAAFGPPQFAADLDLDGIVDMGDTSAFQVDLSPFTGLMHGDFVNFDSFFFPNAVGQFEATYTLNLSDEDLPGELMQTLTLTLMAEVVAAGLPGDYNGDGNVDTADYLVWRRTYGLSVPAYSGADGDGDSMIGYGDYTVWSQNYGNSGSGSAGVIAAVPEPASAWLAVTGAMACCVLRRKSWRRAADVDTN